MSNFPFVDFCSLSTGRYNAPIPVLSFHAFLTFLQVLSGAEMYSSYVGEGEARLRAAFARARAVAPSTLFLDELDGFVGESSSCISIYSGRDSYRIGQPLQINC